MTKKDSFYLTTAIHYANAGPHIGHAYEGVLADIIARYKRGRGISTFFLSGTDEHGDKILRAAEKAGKAPQIFVNENSQKFIDLYKDIRVSNDDFIRTSDKDKHWPGAEALWNKIKEQGDIYEDTYKGLYCVGCESFITEKELVDGKCPHHDAPPEKIEEENYFFRLSLYTNKIKQLIESDEMKIIPVSRKNEILAILDKGLDDISFSRPERDVLWGIPVPNGSNQTIYVWCDALANYVSALGYGTDKDDLFKKFWPADVHIVGKDILRFHALIWPAMLLSAGLPLPKILWAHGFLTSGGKKMSKSIGNVIDPMEYIDTYGVDALRYYLAREISPFEDGDFTEEKFIEVYNANLANGLGNLVSRTLKMSEQYFGGRIKRCLSVDTPIQVKRETMLSSEVLGGYSIPYTIAQEILPEYKAKMDAYDIQKASDVVWELIGLLDKYITDYEPFKLVKTDKDKTENILWNILYGLYFVCEMVEPILPDTAEKIRKLMGAFIDDGEPFSFQTEKLEEPLFKRI